MTTTVDTVPAAPKNNKKIKMIYRNFLIIIVVACVSVAIVLIVDYTRKNPAASIQDSIQIYYLKQGRCLDGSQAAVYIRKGIQPNKYTIFYEGGGWCSSEESCLNRIQQLPDLSSSSNYSQFIKASTLPSTINPNRDINPISYDWTLILAKYCDGFSFAGNNATTFPYRDGNTINTAIMDLIPIEATTDLIITGCSAGGLAVFMHCDTWVNQYPSANVHCLPDSGYFPSNFPLYADFMTSAALYHNYQYPTKILAQDIINTMQSPHHLFLLQSQYDNIWPPSTQTPATINLLLKSNISGFIDSCIRHCNAFLYNPSNFNPYYTPAKAVLAYLHRNETTPHFTYLNAPPPSIQCV